MRRYWALAGGLLLAFLLLFALAEALHIPLLTDPAPRLDRRSPPAALLGVTLLAVDALLPVPSSLVMIAHGALFGVIVGGLLSLIGRTAFTMIGFALGRSSSTLVARVVSEQERRRADALFRRWGALAILVSRPVPLLAETVAVLAGASPLGWGHATLAALAGAAPEALLYALTGAVAATFANSAIVFTALLLVSVCWLLWSRARRLTARSRHEPGAHVGHRAPVRPGNERSDEA